MGVGASRFLPQEEIDKGRAVLHNLGGYLREEAGIKEKRDVASLGVVRLDYDYPPAPGDIDCPKSFGYKVHYRVVPGLTFQMCQEGVLTPQELARRYTDKPVLMSSLVALPSITAAFAHHEQVAIFTANGKSLDPMHDLITRSCGVDVKDNRYVIVGCETVPGFEAVERGEKVDVVRVQPGIIDLAKATIAEYPDCEILSQVLRFFSQQHTGSSMVVIVTGADCSGIRAILLECTELPPYADALRYATGLPVYDAITTADMFIDGFLDNPRFGLDGWMHMFDGKQHKYRLGVELTADDKVKCEYCKNNLVYEVAEPAEKPPKWYKPHRYVKQAIDIVSGKVVGATSSPSGSANASHAPHAYDGGHNQEVHTHYSHSYAPPPVPVDSDSAATPAHLQGASGLAPR